MSPSSGGLIRVAAPLAALALLAALGYMRMRSSGASVQAARSDVETCRKLSAEIIALRKLPQFATVESGAAESLAERIENAAAQSQLPPVSLLRIQPQPPVRVGDSPYRVRGTRLELRDVTLAQLSRFARALVDEGRGLTVRDLRLWRASGAAAASAAEVWSAELTLTQLAFSPPAR
jgi:hypothetical protein